MTYIDRLRLYREIEKHRQRPLVVYVTSNRHNAAGHMAFDVIAEFIRQIRAIPKSEKNIDVMVVSNGGDPKTAWRIISLLREKFTDIAILLPYTAYSAATLLAMGADKIIMHPFANLGPIDPQIISQQRDDKSKKETFGAEDIIHYLTFIKENVGITDQKELQRAFELLCNETGAIRIGIAKRSVQLSIFLGEKLLSMHMSDKNKVQAIVELLNKSFYHHGYPVGLKEAKELGLPIETPDEPLESLMWEVWLSVEQEMQCNRPFNPLEIILDDENLSNILSPVQQIQMPANLPPRILANVLQQTLQQIRIVSVPPVDYETFNATLESIRCKSQFRTKLKISATRLPDMNINLNILPISQGWIFDETQTN